MEEVYLEKTFRSYDGEHLVVNRLKEFLNNAWKSPELEVINNRSALLPKE